MLSRRALLATAACLPAVAHAPNSYAQGVSPTFDAPPKQDDTVARRYRREVLIRWGDRVEFDSPQFDPRKLTVAGAATQFGWDAMVLGLAQAPPGQDGVNRALLAVAHPTAEARMMFSGIDQPAVAAAAQGASILNLEQHGGRWVVTDGGYQSRRITASTLCALSGPAASGAGDTVQGVLAVQGGCITPWGTLLLAEGDPEPWFARLQGQDPRLPDSSRASAFGWMVELDPFDPQSVPGKRTALGRFARGGAAATRSADGRAVVFMTDGREGGYLFRFVSAAPAAPGNGSLLDSGTLSVAVAEGWTLRWVPLPATPMATLDAAGRLQPETFDSPAGLAVGPGGTLFVACRGARSRTAVDKLNPRQANPHGHVLAFRPAGRDPAADQFTGEIVVLGGDMAGDPASPFVSRPSSLTADAAGGLWVGTDESGLFYAAPNSFDLSRAYAPPVGGEMGGMALSPDGGTLFAGVRHPGAAPGATFDRPATRWPTLRSDMPPQSIVAALVLPR